MEFKWADFLERKEARGPCSLSPAPHVEYGGNLYMSQVPKKTEVTHLSTPAQLPIAYHIWDMKFVLQKARVDNGRAAPAAPGNLLEPWT